MINSEKVVEGIDKYKAYITYRLYREGTTYRNGKIIKDLSLLNRDLGKVIMIDCREDSYALQPENAIPLKPWEGNADDKELIKLIPFWSGLPRNPSRTCARSSSRLKTSIFLTSTSVVNPLCARSLRMSGMLSKRSVKRTIGLLHFGY